MNNITGFDQAEKKLGKFRFSEFRIVRELRFYEILHRSGLSQNVDLIVESEDRNPNYRLKLTFSGVTGLKLDNFGGGQTRIIGFDIVDIAERQWEEIRWEVLDFENNTIEFRAKNAEIVSVIPLT
jgi:hypothetical protein